MRLRFDWHALILPLLPALLVVLMSAGCGSSPTQQSPEAEDQTQTQAQVQGQAQAEARPKAQSQAAPAITHVIHISVDGLRSLPAQGGDKNLYLPEMLEAGSLPAFARLRDEGAWTPNARTDFTHTITLPNHTAMITGRPVLNPAGMPENTGHRWTVNSVTGDAITLHNNRPAMDYIDSTFDVAHDAGLSTALYAGKDKFAVYDRSFGKDHGREHDRGRGKIDRYFYHADTATLGKQFLDDMADKHFNYVFLHYRAPDSAGHGKGWGTPAWQQADIDVDQSLGQILTLIDSDPELKGRTAIILTADHGGQGKGHGNPELRAVYTIPVFVWGPGVAPGGDLYEVNDGVRNDPGDGRPDYNADGQPIRNGGTGNLAMQLLGLPAIPGSLINADQSLRIAPAKPE